MSWNKNNIRKIKKMKQNNYTMSYKKVYKNQKNKKKI